LAVLRPEKKEFVRYLVERFGCHAKFAALEYEHIRIHFHQVAATRPPELAPELYVNREDSSETALEFLERVYGEWLRGNGLFQFHLSRLDPTLMTTLNIKHRGAENRARLSAILPTKMVEVSQRIGDHGSMDSTERDRLARKSLRPSVR
jgi:hypothetical protein